MYKGINRRFHEDDHDLLIEIHTNTKGFKEQFEAHASKDEKNFEIIHARLNKLAKIVYVGVGACISLATIFELIRFFKNG